MPTNRWVGAALVVALVAIGAACSSSGSDASLHGRTFPTTTTATKPPYGIDRFMVTFVDRTRPTPRNGAYAGAPTRTLPTLVSYPAGAPRPLPLVIFSTGIDGTATNYAGLYDHWVRAGYAVAAPVFPLSNKHAPGGSTIADFPSQPGDVRFVLTQLLKGSGAKSGPLAGLLNPEQIALAGKSLGALTTLRTAYLVSDHETRERAVISLTGGGDATPEFFSGIKVPLLLEHGDADKTVPYSASVAAFDTAEPPKFFVTLFGQDHGGAFDGEDNAAARVVESTTLDFLDAYVLDGDTGLAKLQHDGTVAKVASIRSDAGT